LTTVKLVVDYCSYQASKYAVTHWHYSKSMPAGKVVKCGVWECGLFVGVVLFSRGANQNIGKAYGLSQTGVCELSRVALSKHIAPVSQIIKHSIKLLKKKSPAMRLIVSYADLDQSHTGLVYQAGNWAYVGKVQQNGGTPRYKVNGKVLHGRQVHSLWGKGTQNIDWLRKHKDPKAELVLTKGKYKYLYPLDRAMRKQIMPLEQQYPRQEI